MKPKYEKPTAVPLGEALKGSGECNNGSIVMPGSGVQNCQNGPNVTNVGIKVGIY